MLDSTPSKSAAKIILFFKFYIFYILFFILFYIHHRFSLDEIKVYN